MEKFVFPMSFRGNPRQFNQVHKSHGIIGRHWIKSRHKTYMVHRPSATAPAYEGNAGAM